VQAFRGQHMGADQLVDGLQRRRAGAHLIGQGRETELDAFAGEAICLPVQGLMLSARHCPRTNGGHGSLSKRMVASRFGPAQPRGVAWSEGDPQMIRGIICRPNAGGWVVRAALVPVAGMPSLSQSRAE